MSIFTPHSTCCCYRETIWSYKTTFDFGEEGGALSYLSGKTIRLSRVPFVEKYFKGVEI